ncbi:MAG TPA: 3-oxoacyl-ACP synthase [Ruminococcaceae bacterium]|jgi:3-oxoacyl-[acyl-carrier-protein] synthase-3|nr:3-oxoacyl-ACP synthase [Oscillospiraceae bacterium]HBG55474.1 3-oxoacyl-ACP synthase [Oscillospiraceae bacterium]
MNFRIIGTGSAHPVCSKTNDDLARLVDTSDEWIYTRTGIKSRYVCTDETISDVAEAAARAALKNAGVAAGELDGILCTTIRGDYFTPSLACVLQERLGAHCPAFDLNAACTGFLYALDVAAGFFVRGRVKKLLIVSCENMSKMLDWSDRATCVLFGDGAGAVVLEEGNDLLAIRVSAQGNSSVMFIPSVSGRSPFNRAPCPASFLTMHGREVYKFAVNEMARQLKAVLADAGMTQQDVTWVLPHQANLRIIEAAQKRLDIPAERFCCNIRTHGNISSAAIPTLMDELNRKNTFHKGDILALVAFGGGLTSGACLLRWE